MAENTPGLTGGLDEPGHSGARPMDSLKGSMGPVFTQPVGLGLDQGEPASAAGTSEAPPSTIVAPIHTAGIGGGAANAREDNQSNVF